MKRRITVQLPEQLVERLEAAAERPGASKSAIVEAALDQFLSEDTIDDVSSVAPPQRDGPSARTAGTRSEDRQ